MEGQTPQPSQATAEDKPAQPAASEKSRQEYLNRLNAIMMREREVLSKEQSLKQNASELEQWNKIKGSKSIDDKLKALGLSYDEITRHYLTRSDTNDSVDELKSRLDELQSKVSETEQERLQRQYDEKMGQAKSELKEFLQESNSEYPLVNGLDETDTVLSLCEQYYEQTGQVLTFADASRMVEEDLQKKMESLRSFKDEAWFKKLIGLESDEKSAQVTEPTDSMSKFDRIAHEVKNSTGQSPRIMHNLSGISSPSATASQSPDSPEAREAKVKELLLKFRAGQH